MPIINKTAKRLSPARTLVFGFLIIIFAGALMLWLPFSTKSGSSAPFFDCLFTAASATCVTGFVIYDTYTHWSLFGQAVIALLVQIGGIGFITMLTFFNIAAGKKLGYRTVAVAADGLTENRFEGGYRIFFSIMKYSLILELCGAVIFATVFVPEYGAYGIWISIFMSITSFCNSGMDLMGIEGEFSSLIPYQNHPVIMITTMVLVILGGLGFVVWENFLNYKKVKKLSLHTQVVLLMSIVLTLIGALFYLIFEWGNPATIGEMSFGDKLMNAFFMSVTTRSSGFNSIPIDGLTDFSQLGTILLMFVGSAPASTGGGIKTTTLLVMIMTVASYIRKKEDVEIFRHKIDKQTVYRTLVVTVLSMVAVGICFTALYCTTPAVKDVGAVACLFDTVAAFSTAGLSAGAFSATNFFGKCIILITMFAGRIGPVSFVMSMTMNTSRRKNVIAPEGQIFIG
ncbi:MAG: potassium transporter Trk [Oscillospiraceae bacterium]|nr:potassium transporter Trk [Oscillospiraceae bacterium]